MSKWFVVHPGEGVQAVGGVCGQPLEKRLERSLRGWWVAPCSTQLGGHASPDQGGTWGHNVNCNCDGNQSGNFKCKNNGGHNGRANGNEMNDMLLVLTCDDAKARRNRPSTGNFRTLGKNVLSL